MIDPKLNGNKVVFGPCRLSYTHLFEKHSFDGTGEGKYSTNVLIPKTEKKTIAAREKAIEAAKSQGILSKWGGKEPRKFTSPLGDGDEREDENYHGMCFINAKSNTRPGVVDAKGAPITDEEDIYSGVWAYVSVAFYPYSVSGNSGVACGLNNVMKYKDDERFGGNASASSDFAELLDNEDDEDL